MISSEQAKKRRRNGGSGNYICLLESLCIETAGDIRR
jgi:hypothetical protein